jgi:hypothetical protein
MENQTNIIKEASVQNKIKQPKNWRKLESPNFYKFENVGDYLEGILSNVETSTRYGFGLYTLKTFNGELKRFHGSNQLDDLLLNVETPCFIQVKFIDIQETANGNMKIFEVNIGEN